MIETIDQRLTRHKITANRLTANRVDPPACVPGHRAQIAEERGIDPASDLTDIETDAECLARGAFTPLEIRQLERRS